MNNDEVEGHRPRCPICGGEIESLDYAETKTTESTVSIVDDKLEYEALTVELDYVGYTCPICEEEVTTDEDEAKRILTDTSGE